MASHYVNPQDVWDLFYTIYDGNEFACAGALGNMQAESGFYSDNAENLWNQLTGHSDEWLTQGINDDSITEAEFLQRSWYVNAYGFGYGLSQWTDETRRRKLWDFTKDNGLDIDSQIGQFNYIRWEWLDEDSHYHQFLPYMKTVGTIYQATKYYCDNYEVGTWNSDRLTYAIHWYDQFAGGGGGGDYYIDLHKTGNGTATVSPTTANQGDTITLYVQPDPGEILEELEATGARTGQSVAVAFQTGYQTFSMPNESVYIRVKFSGESPVPPTPTITGKMPLYMMLKRRQRIW